METSSWHRPGEAVLNQSRVRNAVRQNRVVIAISASEQISSVCNTCLRSEIKEFTIVGSDHNIPTASEGRYASKSIFLEQYVVRAETIVSIRIKFSNTAHISIHTRREVDHNSVSFIGDADLAERRCGVVRRGGDSGRGGYSGNSYAVSDDVGQQSS